MATTFRVYRVMSFVTGCTLLVLTASLIIQGVDHSLYVRLHVYEHVVGIAHGVILYPIYLVSCFTLMLQARLKIPTLVAMLLAGFVPGLAFYMESRVSRQLAERLKESA
jgi:integral membrane protein